MSPHPTSLPAVLTMFQARYPEFNAAGATAIVNALTDARLQVDPDVLGAQDDVACMLLAAHILAMGPGGNPMRIKVEGNPTTTYKQDFDRVVLQNAFAFRPAT